MPLDSSPDEQRAYMQSKAYDFSIITQMARDYGAIPAASVPSEPVFSVLIAKKRTKISSENVHTICVVFAKLGHISGSRLPRYEEEIIMGKLSSKDGPIIVAVDSY
jgi:hypothetical protein